MSLLRISIVKVNDVDENNYIIVVGKYTPDPYEPSPNILIYDMSIIMECDPIDLTQQRSIEYYDGQKVSIESLHKTLKSLIRQIILVHPNLPAEGVNVRVFNGNEYNREESGFIYWDVYDHERKVWKNNRKVSTLCRRVIRMLPVAKDEVVPSSYIPEEKVDVSKSLALGMIIVTCLWYSGKLVKELL